MSTEDAAAKLDVSPFVSKLHQLLTAAAAEEPDPGRRAVDWLTPSGPSDQPAEDEQSAAGWPSSSRRSWPVGAFCVHDNATFEAQVLPRYYRHSNFSSFLRQLNQYGFKKIDTGSWTYAHPSGHFVPGRVDMLHTIHRKDRKRKKRRPARSAPPPQSPAVEFGSFGSHSYLPSPSLSSLLPPPPPPQPPQQEGAPHTATAAGGGSSSSSSSGSSSSSSSSSSPRLPSLQQQLARLSRDHSTVVAELVRVRKQQEKMIGVVHELVTVASCTQDRQTAVEQRLAHCIETLRSVFGGATGGGGGGGGQYSQGPGPGQGANPKLIDLGGGSRFVQLQMEELKESTERLGITDMEEEGEDTEELGGRHSRHIKRAKGGDHGGHAVSSAVGGGGGGGLLLPLGGSSATTSELFPPRGLQGNGDQALQMVATSPSSSSHQTTSAQARGSGPTLHGGGGGGGGGGMLLAGAFRSLDGIESAQQRGLAAVASAARGAASLLLDDPAPTVDSAAAAALPQQSYTTAAAGSGGMPLLLPTAAMGWSEAAAAPSLAPDTESGLHEPHEPPLDEMEQAMRYALDEADAELLPRMSTADMSALP
jgi:hypothetical protein